MREMKDSGVEWIGDIPLHWELKKIKYCTETRDESGIFEPENDRYIGLENIEGFTGNYIKTDTEYETSKQSICKTGDIMFSKLRPYLGKILVCPFDGFCTGELLQFKSFIGEPSFLKYWLLNNGFIKTIDASTYGAKMPRANTPYIINTKMALPPHNEQKVIANHLDNKCSELDKISTDIQHQIELLQEYKQSVITEAVTKGLDKNVAMKDSGIDWIGNVPHHWTVKKVKYLGDSRNGLTYKPIDIVDENEGTLVLRSSNIQDGKLVFNDNVYVSSRIPKNLKVKKGDILICSRNGSRELIGKNTLIDDIDATFGAFMMIYRCIAPRFIYYVLNSEVFKYYLGTFFTSTINQLTGSNFNNMKIVFCPDEEERQKITNYLDEKCSKIDVIIADKQKQLDTLIEYKKSLIYEYVTGKKEVPMDA